MWLCGLLRASRARTPAGTGSLWGRPSGRASAGWNGIGGVARGGWTWAAVSISNSALVSSISRQLRARRLLGLRAPRGFAVVAAVFHPLVSTVMGLSREVPFRVLGRSRHVHVCSLLSCGSQAAFVSRQEPGYRLREGSPATVRQGVPGPLRTQRALRSLAGIDPPREPLGAACPHHVGAARPHHVGAATAVRLAAGPVAPHAPCGLAQPTSLPRGMALGVQRVFQAEAKGKFCWPLDTEGRKAPVPSIMGSFPQALPPGSAGGTMV